MICRIVILGLTMLSLSSWATPVAIIDSGTDFFHEYISDHLSASEDIYGNGIDEDGNGLIDDTFGWNFPEETHIQAERAVIPTAFGDYVRALSVIMELNAGMACSPEDYNWLREIWNGPDAPYFRQEMSKAAQFSHGTHVAGITANESNNAAEIMAIQIMPTVSFSSKLDVIEEETNIDDEAREEVSDEDFIEAFKKWAEEDDAWLAEIALLTQREARVANCSFGTGLKDAETIMKSICTQVGATCDEARITKLARDLLTYYKRPQSIRLISTNPEILFVVAAGNDSVDTDVTPDEPANYITENRITVAATNAQGIALAAFSNYGQNTIDVAAPGEVIESSYPNDLMGLMSGTSQAAPYVTAVAAEILNITEFLTAAEVKEILIGTVDKKDWLKGKLVSEGVVNRERAYRAAELSNYLDVSEAIEQARYEIDDVEVFVERSLPPLHMPADMRQFANELIKKGRTLF